MTCRAHRAVNIDIGSSRIELGTAALKTIAAVNLKQMLKALAVAEDLAETLQVSLAQLRCDEPHNAATAHALRQVQHLSLIHI